MGMASPSEQRTVEVVLLLLLVGLILSSFLL